MQTEEKLLVLRILESSQRQPHLLHGKGEKHFIGRLAMNAIKEDSEPLNKHAQRRLGVICYRMRDTFEKKHERFLAVTYHAVQVGANHPPA